VRKFISALGISGVETPVTNLPKTEKAAIDRRAPLRYDICIPGLPQVWSRLEKPADRRICTVQSLRIEQESAIPSWPTLKFSGMNLPQLKKTVLVTGAGRHRVGNAVAWGLGQAGYRVAIHYHRSQEEADETVAEMTKAGIEADAFHADVADEAQVDRMFDAVAARFGRLDALVATAAIWAPKSLELTTADDLRRNFDVNTLGTFLCARRAGLMMVEQETGGAIVTFGDWAIRRPYPDYIAYFISKGAIPALTQALAVELASRNPRVRVNCIHPGPVLLPPTMLEGERQRIIDLTLLKLADRPDSVAHAVRFLIENEFITGVCLPVDAGRTIYAGEE
jgi:pteridine reductase